MSDILSRLNQLCEQRSDAISTWFSDAYDVRQRPIYSSVDVRNAGYKVAPVDTNLFPAGFNNLTADGHTRAVTAFSHYLTSIKQDIKRVLVVSESHTRNRFYNDNLRAIMRICSDAGLEVRAARLDLQGDATMDMLTSDDGVINTESFHIDNGSVVTYSGFMPDIIFVNNDLSAGCPDMLCDAIQPIFPPPGMGWYRRRKSVHFLAYNQIASEFATQFDIDPWLISTNIHSCGKINFKERKGLECVAIGVDKTIHAIRSKYKEYGIEHDPYVFVKADSGTYGMGVMLARSGDEIMNINKKGRAKMNVIKEGVANSEVIIQEGVPTVDTSHNSSAEPVTYLVGGEPVGTVWRYNEARTNENSLNASGMQFAPFNETEFTAARAIALIGQLATLAAAYEHYDSDTCMEGIA